MALSLMVKRVKLYSPGGDMYVRTLLLKVDVFVFAENVARCPVDTIRFLMFVRTPE